MVINTSKGIMMYEYHIKEVLKVYDGDTITVVIDLGFDVSIKQSIRLLGIDTPEMRGESKQAAIKSRDRLAELLKQNPDTYIKTYLDKEEKYGRMLGELVIPNKGTINQILINEGLAKEYFGGAK